MSHTEIFTQRIEDKVSPSDPRIANIRRYCRRYLAILPLTWLVACAVQPTQVPPSVQQPEPPAAPDAPAPDAAPPPLQPPAPVSEDNIAALQKWVDQQNRLNRIAAPLLINNADLCNRHAHNLLGLSAKTRYSFSGDFVGVAHAALGLGDRLRVMNVLAGSGADQAGVRKGDILIAVESQSLPQGPNAERDSARLVRMAMSGRTSVGLTVLRDGKRATLDVPLTRACAFGIELGNTDDVNSYADGHRVLVTRGMLRFVRSDEELAYVLAKELAHNVLAPEPRADIGAVIDRLRSFGSSPAVRTGAADLASYTPVLDATADKLALYMLVRAGYDIDNALPFWKRLAKEVPEEVQAGHTALHPSSTYRFSVMSEIVKTIRFKQKNRLPLVP
ncbi:M48 family metallopeptidase [Noviherbaspirillum massiliense]|uniref:M48 family metallopeptidase n=1 Tax=Noviherbaspirillum massiliense TaxID=1465823 RepID=UPI0011DE4A53|nr:M48 family metallopeptidase [Noviherbaspirillum massiliense]